VAYVRTVKTSSGAAAVQIVWSTRRGSRKIEHLGSAHDEAGVAALKAAAAQRLAAGQAQLDLGLVARSESEPLPITSSKAAHLWDALCCAYAVLGFEEAAGGDEVFRQLVLARIIEPTSKADSLRVIEETGVAPVSYPTLNRRLSVFAKPGFRQELSTACASQARLGPASLVLYDVTTLHFETDAGDGFREPGFSKERRLDPQITLGLLTDAAGFPLNVAAFEGNKAETLTFIKLVRTLGSHNESSVAFYGRSDDRPFLGGGNMLAASNRLKADRLRSAWTLAQSPRVWIPGVVIVLLAFVVLVGAVIIPSRASDLWMEAAKGSLQLAVVIFIGGAVAAMYRNIESDREQRRARDELRFNIFQQLGSSYQQLRTARRNLKFAGIHVLQASPTKIDLRPEQVKVLRESMLSIVNVTTTLEQIAQELDVRTVFDSSGEILSALFAIVGYTERIIQEWQTHGANFWPDEPSGDLRDLPALKEFLISTEKSFRPKVRMPYENLIRTVQHELLGGAITA